MRAGLIFTGLFLASSAASGQGLLGQFSPLDVCGLWTNGRCVTVDNSRYAKTGNPDLDRAIAICEAHEHLTGVTDGSWKERRVETDYQVDCGKVYISWNKSDTARRIREAEAKEKADREFLSTYAGNLPK
jgi:hypothetical protein